MLKCSKNGCFIKNLQQNGYQAMDKQQEMSNESQKPCKHWVYKSKVRTPRPSKIGTFRSLFFKKNKKSPICECSQIGGFV